MSLLDVSLSFLCFLGCYFAVVVCYRINLQEFLEFIVEHQDEGATSSTEDVGQSSLEEGIGSFLFVDLDPAVQCVLVHNVGLCASRLHHHASSDCVEWIWENTRADCHNLKVRKEMEKLVEIRLKKFKVWKEICEFDKFSQFSKTFKPNS